MKKVQPLVSIIFLFYLKVHAQQQEIGLPKTPVPEAIKCQEFFFYIKYLSQSQQEYTLATGNLNKLGYLVINGVIKSTFGSVSRSCVGQKVEQLWTQHRAFRLFNKADQQPNLTVFDGFPDAFVCDNEIMFVSQLERSTNRYVFTSTSASNLKIHKDTLAISTFFFDCPSKTLDQYKEAGRTENILSKKQITNDQLVYSMTYEYPDAISCSPGYILKIHSFINDIAIYRSFTVFRNNQIRYTDNGNTQSYTSGGNSLLQCKSKSINDLITEGRALYFNTPVIQCPSNMTSNDPLVKFQIFISYGFTYVATPASNTYFPYGVTTTVNVQAKNASGKVKISCTFDVTIGPDTLAPKLTCPQDIQQKDLLVSFEALATDNDTLNSIKISYDKAPNTQFQTGLTVVNVTATDAAGNSATCSFRVQIYQILKETIPVIKKDEEEDSVAGIIIGLVASAVVVIVVIGVVVTVVFKKHKMACYKRKRVRPIKQVPADSQNYLSHAKKSVPQTSEPQELQQ